MHRELSSLENTIDLTSATIWGGGDPGPSIKVGHSLPQRARRPILNREPRAWLGNFLMLRRDIICELPRKRLLCMTGCRVSKKSLSHPLFWQKYKPEVLPPLSSSSERTQEKWKFRNHSPCFSMNKMSKTYFALRYV